MKPLWIATALGMLAVFFLLPGVRAIDPPTVSFIPVKPSVNSSFIMIANPNAQSFESVYLSYVFPGIYPVWQGTFQRPKSGNQWIKYFSNSDPQSDGPTLFPSPSGDIPYTVLIDAWNQYGQEENVSVNISIGGIAITPDISIVGTNVYMIARVGSSISGTVSYKVYDADSLDAISGATGTMTHVPNLYGYTKNITLSNGEYFIEFTATSATDFGGGLARITVGSGGPGPVTTGVTVEPIIYKTTIKAGDTFTLKRFRITNTGTENLTDLDIIVDQQTLSVCNCQINITPEKTSLLPNESTIMDLALIGIKSPTNLSFSATLQSGANDIYHIPVNLDIGVIQSSCSGKDKDGTDCLGGICCDNECRKNPACCSGVVSCGTGQVCTNYKCVSSAPVKECDGKAESDSCSGGNGRCCGGVCKTGDCCSSSDCLGLSEICVLNKCQTPQITTCSNDTQCSPGKCCSGSCVTGNKCCSSDDCPGTDICQDGSCISKPNRGCTSDSNCTGTGEVCQSGSCVTPSGLDMITIAMVGGGVAIAAIVGFLLLKKFKKKGSGEEELGGEDKEEGEEELSDEDFY